jgi:arylsulfatase A-like enzyme
MSLNVLFITIDCLRVDHLSCYGYNKVTSPNIDQLAENSVVFKNAFSTGPGTRQSFPGIFTSTYPLMYGGYELLSNERTSFVEVLKKNQLDTGGFSSNIQISRFYNYHKGFNTFFDPLGGPFQTMKNRVKLQLKSVLNPKGRWFKIAASLYRTFFTPTGPYPDATKMTDKVLSWIGDCTSPFFGWVHYMDVHGPWMPPPTFQEKLLPNTLSKPEMQSLWTKITTNAEMTPLDLQNTLALYDAGIMYVDACLGTLFKKLDKDDLLKDTIIIITADHGEEFGEHGDFDHYPKLYDELLHVPLIISVPEHPRRTIDETVSLIDLAPTIVELVNLSPIHGWEGKTLVPLITGINQNWENRAVSEVSHEINQMRIDPTKRITSIRTNEWKFIVNEADETRELYQLSNDPGETINVYNEEPAVAKIFELKMKEHLSRYDSTFKIQPFHVTEDEDIKERLKKLGYL